MSYNTLYSNQPMSTILSRGTIIWRCIDFEHNSNDLIPKLHTTEFETTSQNSLIGKIRFNHFGWEPVIVESKNRIHGIVTFIKGQLIENWTHLIITGVSKALQQPGYLGKGSAIFAEVAKPYDMDDYIAFRKELAIKFCEMLNESNFENIIEASNSIWIKGARFGDKRLVLNKRFNGENDNDATIPLFDYNHLLVKPKER